jgi:hypothetical protein
VPPGRDLADTGAEPEAKARWPAAAAQADRRATASAAQCVANRLEELCEIVWG